ncbi:lysophospholipid acyltransferase 2-like [Gigantopelta aegis]|uniref:lysophospholipid acyltransferase 2-like n=1 Tax=Gigantopelta aegis TaxID=1735272 RepID=UPI001B889FCB|nr:lysophospholipid acyltransferase 2-like [Gigantopelta aegis]
MVRTGEFYGGSRLLIGISFLPIDQVNFLFCQTLALLFAFPFRKHFSPQTCGVVTRHAIELVFGVSLAYFCFGYQIYHLFLLALGCYLLMRSGQKWMHIAVFIFTMTYLSVIHIFRQYYDYGGYTLDITGPMMIMVQKLTSIGFSYHDGVVKSDSELTPEQKLMAVRKLPDVLTFLSYLFYFHGIMCGPFTFFSDYLAFIDGTNFSKAIKPAIQNDISESSESPEDTSPNDISESSESPVPIEDTSPNKVVAKKLMITAFFGIIMITLLPRLPPDYLLSDEYNQLSFLTRHFWLLVIISLVRAKYYFAWKLGELVNNAAGLGFHGYDSEGRPKWDLVNNVDIYRLETCNSLKVNVECWNITSTHWLRHVVYNRTSKNRTAAVFACSAIWHGFYPGYYVTFATGALFTFAARQVRRNIRPYFQTSENLKVFYDCVTFIATRLANVIMCAPFTVLEFVPSIRVYSSTLWWMHILSILAILYFNITSLSKKKQ